MKDTDCHHGHGESRCDERRFEWTGDTALGVAVVEAVASVSDRDPTEIDPLNESLDPDALDALFESGGDGGPRKAISFSVADHRVVVDSDGDIVVYPPETVERQ